jgi:hypothetical protein
MSQGLYQHLASTLETSQRLRPGAPPLWTTLDGMM